MNDDLISRQAAIDVLDIGCELLRRVLDDTDVVGVERAKYEWGLGLIESYISDMRDLPSAQPEEQNFEKQIHAMFDHIWDCEIDHPIFQDTVGDLMGAVIQCHKGLPPAQPKWIPVTERLPEDSDYHDLWETPDGAVLWCKATGEIGVGWYYESTKNWCDLWDNGVKDVIAWMPLPESYQKGGE